MLKMIKNGNKKMVAIITNMISNKIIIQISGIKQVTNRIITNTGGNNRLHKMYKILKNLLIFSKVFQIRKNTL